jgi:hypothetical protein
MGFTKFTFLLAFMSAVSFAGPNANDPAWHFTSQFTYHGYGAGGLSWSKTVLPVGENVTYLKVVKPNTCYSGSTLTLSVPVTVAVNYVATEKDFTGDHLIFAVENGDGSLNLNEFSIGYSGIAGEICNYAVYRMVAPIVAPPPYPEGATTAHVLLKPVTVNGSNTNKWAYESCYEGIRRAGLNIVKVADEAPFRLDVSGDGKTLYELPQNLSCVQSISWNR